LAQQPGNVINWGSITGFTGIHTYQTILGANYTFEITATLSSGANVTLTGSTNKYQMSLCDESYATNFCDDTASTSLPTTYSYNGAGDGTEVIGTATVPTTVIPSNEYDMGLDSCGCDKLFDMKKKYIDAEVNHGLSTLVTFDQFFTQQTGYSLSSTSASTLESDCYNLFAATGATYNGSSPIPGADMPYPMIYHTSFPFTPPFTYSYSV